jgi:hypothetical protein
MLSWSFVITEDRHPGITVDKICGPREFPDLIFGT